MAALQSLLSRLRSKKRHGRKIRRDIAPRTAESLEERLLLTNPDPFSSNPGAEITVYLDFNGHVENDPDWVNIAGSPITTPAFSMDADDANFSLDERTTIEEIYLRVAEDFAPFGNVNITTVDPGQPLGPGEGVFVAISGDDGFPASNTYNDGFLNGFTETNNSSTTAYVFTQDYESDPRRPGSSRPAQFGRDIANGITEVIGRTLGLAERATAGNTEVSPLMSDNDFPVGLRDIWQDSGQDDLALIEGAGLTFAADEHGNTAATATAVPISGAVETVTGVIGRNDDVDYFTFTTVATTATFSVAGLNLTQETSSATNEAFSSLGVTNGGTNLDASLSLLDANGNVLASNNPPFAANGNSTNHASLENVILTAGTYYLEVGNSLTYGSLGQYTLTMEGTDTSFTNAVPPLNGLQGAPVTIYLDFNGHVVQNPEILVEREDGINQPFYVPAFDTDGDRTSFSTDELAQIEELWARVAEDFMPYNVNVTTSDPFVYGNRQGILVSIGGDGTWRGAVGTAGEGFAAFETFGAGTGDNNAVVFGENAPDMQRLAQVTTSRVLEAMGLTEPVTPPSAAWTSLPRTESVETVRDFDSSPAQVVASANGIVFRGDEYSDNSANATLVGVGPGVEQLDGVIQSNIDEDWLRFRTLESDATISIRGLDLRFDPQGTPVPGVTNPGSNLIPRLRIYDENLAQVGAINETVDPSDPDLGLLSGSVSLTLPAGLYFLQVDSESAVHGAGQYLITLEGIDGTPVDLSFTQPEIAENAGVVAGIGRIDRPLDQPISLPLTIDLISTDTGEVTVPASVTIPPNQDFITFDVTAVDDNLLDGTQNIEIQAYVSGLLNDTTILKVGDHETISAVVNPNPVAENAGPAGATLTVTRSNTDINSTNHWTASGDELQERDPSGNVLQSIPIEWPAGARPVIEIAHDVQVLQNGNVALINGTGSSGTGFLSIYNITLQNWRHIPIPGLSASVIDQSQGGITSIGDFIFLTDFESFDGDPRGILRVNTVTEQVDRFADQSNGARMFLLNGSVIDEINPVTGTTLNTLSPLPTIGVNRVLSAVTFDGENLWVLFTEDIFGTGGSTNNELQKLNPDTGEILESHTITFAANEFSLGTGMAFLNDRIYFNLPGTGVVFQDRTLVTYDPSTRQLIGTPILFEEDANIYTNWSIAASQGDGTPLNPDALVVYGTDALGATVDVVYFLSPQTGAVIGRFNPGLDNFVIFDPDGTVGAIDDVIIAGQVERGLIYVNDINGYHIFRRNGAPVDIDPDTFPIDFVPHDQVTHSMAVFSGADVPGIAAQELSFRDVTLGVTDHLLYGLVENGTQVTVYNPDTLGFVRDIFLDSPATAIAVDENGNIVAGGINGDVRIFDSNGNTTSILNTTSLGLASIVDIDANISQEVLISDLNGNVVTAPRTAIENNDPGLFSTDLANTGGTTFVSFGRHLTLPTGPLVVSLSSSDTSEIQTIGQVVIPVGDTSVSVPIDIIDDNLLDGTQTVFVTGDAPNYDPVAAVVDVLDAESVGVEIRSNTFVTVNDASQVQDGDRLFVRVNGDTRILEIEDTAVNDWIRPSSHAAVLINFSTNPDENTIAAIIEAAIDANTVGVGTSVANNVVTLTGAPYFATVNLSLGNPGALTAEKPIAETAGVQVDGIRIFRTDVAGPYTVPATTGGTNSETKFISDNGVTLSQIVVPNQVSEITDLNVTLSVEHEFIPDLDVTLVSPSGTRVRLFSDLRSNETTLSGTTIDDEAAVRIVDGSAPYSGSFIGQDLLSLFDGENPSGVWTLEIVDDNVSDTGSLLGWSLDIATIGLSATEVTLDTTDASEATVSGAPITIPAAASEIFLDFTVHDDSIVDGTQDVNLGVASTNLGNVFGLASDEVQITDVENLSLTLSATSFSEGDGPAVITGTVSRSDTDLGLPLTVYLVSSDPSELAVPAMVTIQAGENSVTFDIDAVDDVQFDGNQTANITASASGYVSVTSDTVTIIDQEPQLVLATANPTVSEDGGTVAIALSRVDTSDLSAPLVVDLSSSDTSELTVPAQVTIPVDERSVVFVATIVDDNELDGARTVTITATDSAAIPGLNSGSVNITVNDAESITLTIPGGAHLIDENDGLFAATGTVTVSSVGHTQPIQINLVSSDETEVGVPGQVEIPVGSSSATFPIEAIDDFELDRDQTATITGSSAGYSDGTVDVIVRDFEPAQTVGPNIVTVDPAPTIQWAPLPGASRYDLWVNDESRGIPQLFRLTNIQPTPAIFSDNFDGVFLDSNNIRVPNPALWTTSDVTVDDQSLNDPTNGASARLNGDPNGGDTLTTADMDLSDLPGGQLRYAFQRTGLGDTPDADQDLTVEFRDADGVWRFLDSQAGGNGDMTRFETVLLQLPQEALHNAAAFRFSTVGQTVQSGVPGIYDDWYLDFIEVAANESFTPTQEIGIGQYRFWVRAYNDLNQPLQWSNQREFLVRTAPTIIAPAAGGNAQSGPTVIEWETVPNAAYYDLWVDNLTTGVRQQVYERGIETTSFATSLANLGGGTYRAWVQAFAPNGFAGRWSESITFSILHAPTNLTPDGPIFDQPIEFNFDATEGAANYELWLVQNFENGAIQYINNFTGIPTNSYTLEQTLPLGSYTFWVRAFSTEGTASEWSAAQPFEVGGQPTILSPSNSANVASTFTIIWDGIEQADYHLIWINDLNTGQRVQLNSSPGNSYTLTTPLEVGRAYRIWVRAIGTGGQQSQWSEYVDVNVVTADVGDSVIEPLSSSSADATVAAVQPAHRYVVTALATDVTELKAEALMVEQEVVAEVDGDTAAPSVPTDELPDVDAIMSDWNAVDTWMLESETEEENSDFHAAAALGLGIAATGSVLRRRPIRRRRD